MMTSITISDLWLFALAGYAAVWTIYGVIRWVKRWRPRRVPGPWRVTGSSDLMSPPTINWFADNAQAMQVRGPYTTAAEAQATCTRLNRESQKRQLFAIRYGNPRQPPQ
jgi:hypothetical protein